MHRLITSALNGFLLLAITIVSLPNSALPFRPFKEKLFP